MKNINKRQVMKMEIFKLFGSIFVDTTEADEKISKTDEKRKKSWFNVWRCSK